MKSRLSKKNERLLPPKYIRYRQILQDNSNRADLADSVSKTKLQQYSLEQCLKSGNGPTNHQGGGKENGASASKPGDNLEVSRAQIG